MFYKYAKALGGKKILEFLSLNFFGPSKSTIDGITFLPMKKI